MFSKRHRRQNKRLQKWQKFGKAIRRLRKRRGLTPKDVVNTLEKNCCRVTADYLRKIERGEKHFTERDVVVAMLTKVFKLEHLPTINRVLSLADFDGLSSREIKKARLGKVNLPRESRLAPKASAEELKPFLMRTIADPVSRRTAGSLTSGLVAYYTFSGNANDLSGNGNHGTVCEGTRFVTGRYQHAAGFDGAAGNIVVPDSPSLRLTRFTLAVWAMPSMIGGGSRILEKGNSNSYWLYLNSVGKALAGFYDGEYRNLRSPAPLQINIWHHIVVTYDDVALKLYINAILVNSMLIGSAPRQTDEPLIIGWKFGGIGIDHYAGLIDELRIYDRALSDPEIRGLYDSYVIPFAPVFTIQHPAPANPGSSQTSLAA